MTQSDFTNCIDGMAPLFAGIVDLLFWYPNHALHLDHA